MNPEMLMQIKVAIVAATIGFASSYIERLNQADRDYSVQLSSIETQIKLQNITNTQILSTLEKQDSYVRKTSQDVSELRGKFSQLERQINK